LGNSQPITSAASASQDNDGRLWIYFGTGQFYHENDKANTDTQRLVGVKEPLDWNNCTGLNDPTQLTISCNNCTSAVTVPSDPTTGNLLDVTNYNILAGGLVDTTGDLESNDITFDELVEDIKQTTSDTDDPKHYDGWYLDMTGGERCFSKPTVLGGIITFTTFEPDYDICAYEGEGFLYALFYKTGTAFYADVIGFDGTSFTKSISLGAGVAATPSLHLGTEEGAKAFVQSSTGEIEVIEEINLPSPYKSRPLHWIQPGD
jgi:type IV pilus assembly protein PilY1